MPADPIPAAETASKELREQIAEHARIMGWLARLDSSTIDAPAGASAQVRADYLDRMSRIVAAVVQRTGEIRGAVAAATQRITDARDRIPALRVRHAVGELDDAALTQCLSSLRQEAAEAELERSTLAALLPEADATIERLRSAGIGIPTAAPPRVEEANAREAPAPRQPTEMDDAFGEWRGPAKPAAGAADDDLGFLDALPLSGTPGQPGSGAPPQPAVSTPPSPPPAGPPAGASLVCRMCGGISAASAWYCDGCGAELG